MAKYCKVYNKTHYYLPIYGININIVFNADDFVYLCKKYQDFDCDVVSLINGYCLMNPDNQEITIGIFNNDLGTVTHEITHAALFILDNRFMNPFDSNGEAMAYLQQHLFYEIKDRLEQYNKVNNGL